MSTRVDELDKLGRAFGIEAWELLRPHGHAALSPLARLLAAHLDRAAPDAASHSAAFAAASAAIDALAAAQPAAGPAPARAKLKPSV